MSNLNNLLKSAIRKHALANGISNSGWSDAQMEAYAAEHGITERDNLKKPQHTQAAPKAEPKAETKTDAGVEAAIKALIDSTKPALDEDRVLELIRANGKTTVEHVVRVQKGEETAKIEGAHKDTAKVLAMIAAGVNVVAVGPAGSGKSTMFEQIAESLELDYYFQGAVQQEHKILGYMDANGQYVGTQFRDAYENGGLFVFEEYDGSSARALLAINNAVAGSWCDFPDGKIAKHDDFVCVMAGNTFGTGASRQYVGRSQLDAATMDRFAFIEIGYDEDMELRAAEAHFEGAAAWVHTVQSFRRKIEAAGIRHVVSPRASIMGAKLLKSGVDVMTATEVLLHKGLSTDQLAQLS